MANIVDNYTKADWEVFLKQGAYRGLKINKLAKRLEKSDSFTYNCHTHELDLVYKTDRDINIKVEKLLRKNERWSIARLIHNIRMWFPDSDYAKEFNDRISRLADRIIQNTIGIEHFPTEIQNHIWDAVCQFGGKDAQVLNKLNNLLVCKSVSRNITTKKYAFINDHNVCLQTLGNKTLSDAIQYVKDKKPTSANFSYFKKFNDGHLGQLIAANPQLTKLSILSKYITGDKLAELIEIVPDLESLTLNKCRLQGYRLAEAIAKLPKLKILDLKLCSIFSEDKFFDSIGNNSKIENMNFEFCNLSFRRLPDAMERLSNLRDIVLGFRYDQSGASIVEVVKKLPPQKTFNFDICRGISEEQLGEIVELHPRVEKLSLRYCNHIAEVQFLEKALNLQELDLSYCEYISEAEIAKVPLLLPDLKTLYIWDCDQISDETIADLRAKYPQLKIVPNKTIARS